MKVLLLGFSTKLGEWPNGWSLPSYRCYDATVKYKKETVPDIAAKCREIKLLSQLKIGTKWDEMTI